MKYIIAVGVFLSVSNIFSQNDLTDKKHYHDIYVPDSVIHEKYGVTMYAKWNMMFGNDSIRNDRNGYAANGFLEDYYTTGELLHKGFYVDGQLKIYKNYFPNGSIERNFRMVDLKKSKMDIFYEDGSQKSKIQYVGSEALKWEDYYKNGNIEFVEEYHKSMQYYIFKANYYEDGSPENTLELTNKKKLVFLQTYFYSNGQKKSEGELKYDQAEFDYLNIGTWKQFNDDGKPTKEIKYAGGKIHSEKDL